MKISGEKIYYKCIQPCGSNLPFQSQCSVKPAPIFILFIFLIFAYASPAAALTCTVNDLGDLGDANLGDAVCATSGGACTLRAAIQQINSTANSSNTIQFSGALPLPGTVLLGSSLPVITRNITITGPGSDLLTINGQDLYAIFAINSGANNGVLQISDLRLIRGKAYPWNGGAVSADIGDSLSLTRMVFEDNNAGSSGGAVYCNDCGTLSISYSRLTRNTAPYLGGGVFAEGATFNVDHSVFERNVGSSYFNGGGAMTIFSGSGTITDSVFDGNEAFRNGGGLDFECVNDETLSIRDSLFVGNSAGNSGGGIYLGHAGSVLFERVTVSGNRALAGGGISMSEPPVSIANSTISGNSALCAGGGIYNSYSPLGISNVTITDNTADADKSGSGNCLGGGVYLSARTLAVQNSVIAANVSLNASYAMGSDCYNAAGSVSSGGYNVIGDAAGCTFTGSDQVGTTASPLDPLLLPLSWNGGATPTHALSFTSPAKDLGNVTGCTWDHDADGGATPEVILSNDQRTAIRPSGARCDVGAYEWSHCDDGVLNYGETGIDCGGGGCAACSCTGTDAKILSTGYATIQGAYDAALDSALIRARETDTGTNLVFDRMMYVTLRGGHDCDFFRIRGMTTVASLIVSSGRLTIENVAIGP